MTSVAAADAQDKCSHRVCGQGAESDAWMLAFVSFYQFQSLVHEMVSSTLRLGLPTCQISLEMPRSVPPR